MAKAVESKSDAVVEETADAQPQEIDSKYRLIIVAAQRSKQLQRGARPRVDFDTARHKPTRIALEEVLRGKITFEILEKE